MLDWNNYRSELMQRLGELGKLTPETMKGVVALGNAGNKTDLLGAKVRELIALAGAVTTRCDGCIAFPPDLVFGCQHRRLIYIDFPHLNISIEPVCKLTEHFFAGLTGRTPGCRETYHRYSFVLLYLAEIIFVISC